MASREQKRKSKEKKKEQPNRSNLSLPDSHSESDSRPEQATLIDSAGKQSSILVTERKFSGPLPSPDVLRDYDTIQPGFAERIFSMAEREQGTRHKLSNRSNLAENFGKVVGLFLAGLITLTGIGGSFLLIYADKSLEGFGTLLLALTGLVGTAAYRHRHRARNQEPVDE